jgi:hypothetical protein
MLGFEIVPIVPVSYGYRHIARDDMPGPDPDRLGSPHEGNAMTYASAGHRALDRAAATVMGDRPGQALVASRNCLRDIRTMNSPRVLLTTLSARTSPKGRPHLSGFLGKSRVVAFEGEADRFGNPTWDVFVAEPELRQRPPGGEADVGGAAFHSDRRPRWRFYEVDTP